MKELEHRAFGPGRSLSVDAPERAGYGGAAKAALVLLAMERSKALELLKSLDPEDVRTIFSRADELKFVDGAELDAIVSEFEAAFNEGVKFVGTPTEVRSLVSEALGADWIGEAMSAVEPIPMSPPPWQELAEVPDDTLEKHIVAQHPQVAAFVLSKIDEDRCTELLQKLPVERMNDLLARLLTVRDLPDAVVDALHQAVREDLLGGAPAASGNAVHQLVATIINEFDQDRSRDALTFISTARPDDARIVRKLLFKFEDLPRLPAASLAIVVERLPVERIVLALRGASPDLQALVLGAMAPRARRMAESELRSDAPAPAKAVTEARRFVAQAVLKMASAGTIELPSSDEEPQ